MHQRRRRALGAIVMLAAVACGGCGLSQTTSYFPFLLPAGDIIRTHPKPPGFGYFANFDPKSHRVEVRPESGAVPVGRDRVYIATVYDRDGRPLRNRRVEWLVEGVGNVIEVDESGYAPGRGYKVNNRYAVSYTDYFTHRITRGNGDPSDDFMVRPGQTWCVVRSNVQGNTAVTAYVPGIADWGSNRVVVRTVWVDAACEFPPGAVLPAGRGHALTSRVVRPHDGSPLPGYRVRYRLARGSAARLVADGVAARGTADEVTVVSDAAGRAPVRVEPTTAGSGEAELVIETVRPADPSVPGSAATVVARGKATVRWQAAEVRLKLTAPPEMAFGRDVPVTLSVRNEGDVESEPTQARLSVPTSFRVSRTEPPATRRGGELVWSVPALAAGQQTMIQAYFRPTRPGKYTALASAASAVESAVTHVITGELRVAVSSPRAAVSGEEVPVEVTVTNTGTAAVRDIRVRQEYDDGLIHAGDRNPVEGVVNELLPGQSRSLTFRYTAREAGSWGVRTTAAAGEVLARGDPVTLAVGRAELGLSVDGADRLFVNRSADWTVRVRNGGGVPLDNAVVRVQLPPELRYVRSEGGTATGDGGVQWNLGRLAAGASRELRFTGEATALRRVELVADVTAEPAVEEGVRQAGHSPRLLRREARRAVEVLGVPAVEVDVTDQEDTVAVGGRTVYEIRVRNNGTLAARGLGVKLVVPPEMRPGRAFGPFRPKFDGNTVTFRHDDELPPGRERLYKIEAIAERAGDARFHAEVTGPTMLRPVVVEEATRVLP